MWWLLIAPVWIALLIGLVWVFLRTKNQAGRYEAIFEPSHLIEFAEVVKRIRREALQAQGLTGAPGFEDAVREALPPGAGRTGAGLVLFYSVDREGEKWRHHFSMSYDGSFFAESTGKFLAAYFHHLMGLRGFEVSVALSRGGRYHMAWELDRARQEEFETGEVEVPAPEALQEVLEQCWHTAGQVRIDRMQIAPPGGLKQA